MLVAQKSIPKELKKSKEVEEVEDVEKEALRVKKK